MADQQQNPEQAFTDAAKQAPPADDTSAAETAAPAEASAASPEPEQQQQETLLDMAQAMGISTEGIEDEKSLLETMHRQLQEAQPYVDYARQVLPYNDQIQQAIQGGQPEQQPEPATDQTPEEDWTPQKHFQELWKAPQYDEAWDGFIKSGMIQYDGKTGRYVPADGYQHAVPPQVIQGINQFRDWQKTSADKLMENPYQLTWDAFQEPLQRLIQQEIQNQFGTYEQGQDVASWEAQHVEDLYVVQDGEVQYDLYGNPKMTEYGEQFLRAFQQIQQDGVTDQRRAIEYAERMAAPYLNNGQKETEETPPEQPAQKQSFVSEAVQKAAHSPSSGAYAENPDVDPGQQTGRELESMFQVAARKAGIK